MNMNCRLPIPYPSVRVERPRHEYADILIPLYTGAHSELTAISTYGYQSIITKRRDKHLSDILDCIAMIEMRHFCILGELISKCGIDPVLYISAPRGRVQYWNSHFADFSRDTTVFLHNNINSEKHSIDAYQRAYRDIPDQGIRPVIERIIADEEHHIEIFDELLK